MQQIYYIKNILEFYYLHTIFSFLFQSLIKYYYKILLTFYFIITIHNLNTFAFSNFLIGQYVR